jgi:DNA invertase Pin-like site-specific DNA recombinase
MTYQEIISKLQIEKTIKKIAEETEVTRDTGYRIKKELI